LFNCITRLYSTSSRRILLLGERIDRLAPRQIISRGIAQRAEERAGDLPFGSLKRVEIARALASRPKLLLLDEPASGLTHGEALKFGALITRLRAALLGRETHHRRRIGGPVPEGAARGSAYHTAVRPPSTNRLTPLM
jgi:ABC-type branched-subunit amino acid transport system ATPase component